MAQGISRSTPGGSVTRIAVRTGICTLSAEKSAKPCSTAAMTESTSSSFSRSPRVNRSAIAHPSVLVPGFWFRVHGSLELGRPVLDCWESLFRATIAPSEAGGSPTSIGPWMRILLYTGKGGVGKTTVAAATAVRLAKLGYRTMVMSTDLAHSLSDSLDRRLEPEPTEVAPNLWAQETDIYYNLKTYWGRVRDWLNALLAWRQIDEIVADEVSILPGMEELANLLWINRHRERGQFDVVVVDCAPTGETLRLLSFPEIGRWWIDKILPIHRAAAQFVRPIVRATSGLPMPENEVYDAVKDLFDQLDRLHGMLVDPELTSVRLV